MHQHAPVLLPLPVPHSNDVPQRAQARRRSGNIESVDARLISALSGVMAGKINHVGMTGLRQQPYRAARLS
jgi:hypothetical protein